ncbi:MAG: hypothetical protein OQK48_03140 [Sulfurimonas sp.]|uniref:hypothetical protein n=1 Tax=Sulfurimonas sp. TaxID=2022749 RepID=UPI002621E564|nr:hypothetical protein [Sulfurimonas sp.]MCW8895673.1 hypothetical protein [Sulfurimonas sp.]MCW8953917.1 hypothetical protein [Sulfurimonas sp.]MCW9067041.1 hypothetical protein [Sulfurimonas sp.]
MGIKKFVNMVTETLGLDDFKISGKKKSIKKLLKKLKKRRVKIYKSFHSALSLNEKIDLQEELDIISLQIEKGQKLLNKLNHYSKS